MNVGVDPGGILGRAAVDVARDPAIQPVIPVARDDCLAVFDLDQSVPGVIGCSEAVG
jgi:hypothetical protein